MPDLQAADFIPRVLGPCEVDSPLAGLLGSRQSSPHYVHEGDRVLYDDTVASVAARGVPMSELPGFEPAGPRSRIFFEPSVTRAGIVTCGGLCPGLNDVIRGLVLELASYGVTDVVGFLNGYRGLVGEGDAVRLTPSSVEGINEDGGTVLGTSRGGQDPTEMADCLQRRGIEVLFVLGGDGTLRGALAISKVAQARGQRLAVVGVPKTIDNDIPFLDQSFGFHTAFSKAAETIRAARVEARSSPPGVGLVKLMGRHSGFIACYAALARNDADFVLIPEVPLSLEGPASLPGLIRRRVEERGHAVVVVAEGAGQDLVTSAGGSDASGNKKLGDIGLLLRQLISAEFDAAGGSVNMRYFDPSYSIRSVPADPYDSVYCTRLSYAAVHAAMAGRTGVVVGRWRRRFVHLPIELAVSERNQVDRRGDLWMAVLESTRQPDALA